MTCFMILHSSADIRMMKLWVWICGANGIEEKFIQFAVGNLNNRPN
jgi:hypothetical protein